MKTSLLLTVSLSLFLLLIITTNAAAQIEYQKGYVVTMNQDTIRGVIMEKLNKNSFDILLKESASAKKEVLYTPDDIQEIFFVEGQELYQSKTIEVEEEGKVKVFFKHLIAGPVDLFSFVDKFQKEHFYIQTQELGTQELLVKINLLYNKMAQKSYSESYNVFHGMLKLALKDCPKIYPEIEKTELFEKKLIACILKFYECTGETYWTRNANLKKRKKTIFEFGTWGGVNFKPVSSNFKSPTSTPLPGMAFGVINRVFLPKNGYRYSFDFGVSFYQRSLRYSLNAEVIKTTQVYAPIRFTQHFSSRKFHSFASIGVELGKPRDNIDTFPFTAGGGCELKLGKKFKIALIGNFRILKISQADIGLVLFFT